MTTRKPEKLNLWSGASRSFYFLERDDMTTKQRRAFLLQQIGEQRNWIARCGLTLGGYVKNYGSKDDPEHSGEGGEAIYQADMAALRQLESDLAALPRQRARK